MRVVLVELPTLLADVLSELAREHPTLELTSLHDRAALLDTVERSSADVLIATVPGLAMADLRAVLERFPRLRAIVLLDGGGRAVQYELRLCGADLGDVSPRALLQAIDGPVDWSRPILDDEPHRS